MANATFDVRDNRSGGWFWADNDLIRRDGPELGAHAIAVYCALCTYAGNKGEAIPSVPTIARQLAVSENTVRDALKKLAAKGWIAKEFRTIETPQGYQRNLSNRYVLLPKPGGDKQQAAQAEVPASPLAAGAEVTTVVNVRMVEGQRPPHDVYIGRASGGLKGSEWQNPFRIGQDGDRDEVIQKNRAYLTNTRPDLLAKIPDLVGKRLGCWCAPEPCHGDFLVELAEAYRVGGWEPPDPADFPAYQAPAAYTVAEIKSLKLTRSQWEQMLEAEKVGKRRRGVIDHCEQKLNAHPLEPRFEEMMQAVDACTVQSVDDPGMAREFAQVVRGKLWASRENYYTPEDLAAFAQGHKVQNVHFLVGKLSEWKNGGMNGNGGPNRNVRSDGSDPETGGESVWEKMGRTGPPQPVQLEDLAEV